MEDALKQIATSSSSAEANTQQLIEMMTPPPNETGEAMEDPMLEILREILPVIVKQSSTIMELTERLHSVSKKQARMAAQIERLHRDHVDAEG